MQIHLTDETARYLEARLRRDGYRSASDFLEDLLRQQRLREAGHDMSRRPLHRAQEQVAAAIWENDADARYDAL
jgi:Arc/MetJ-type ribon-helix-helix transcriptional regulator